VPFPQPGIFGNRLVYVNLDIDEKTLEAIAGQTGGRHFFATDTRKLEEIYREIGRLEKTEAKVKHYEYFDEYFIYFAYAGLALLFLDLGLKATWLRRLA
jgi:Ca-activated chloride channel family protein